MTKTMLTVFVLTVVITAYAVLGDDDSSCEEKYCDMDLAHNLCMENIDLTQADGRLVTMMMMIMTSTMVVVVMVIIITVVMVKMIMVVIVMMPMLIVLMMVAMVVVMMMLLVVVLQTAMLVIAMMMIGIFMMVMVMIFFFFKVSPQFLAHKDCLLIKTLKIKFVAYIHVGERGEE